MLVGETHVNSFGVRNPYLLALGTKPHWVLSFLLSASLTAIVGFQIREVFGLDAVLAVCSLHFVALFLPLGHTLGRLIRLRDPLDPTFVAGATFVVFHVLFNPLVLVTPALLAHRGLDTLDAAGLVTVTSTAYVVLIVSWLAYLGGLHFTFMRPFRSVRRSGSTPMFLFVGAAFVILGVIGNIGFLGGGLGLYLQKMPKFYERWSVYEDNSVYGGTKWEILMRFLPVGAVMMAYGGYLTFDPARRRRLLLIGLLSTAAFANVFLSCATGGRGILLWSAIFAVIVYNHVKGPISLRSVAVLLGAMLVLAFILGQLRAASYYGTNPVFDAISQVSQFAGLYLTNFVGTLALVREVLASGTVGGHTAFGGLTGLFGGTTPLTTQAEIWYRLTGSYAGSNPRYGLPGELFFNFGWLGVIIGMALLGATIKGLTRWKEARTDASLASTFVAVFVVFSAQFLMIANMDYIPPYFTYFSAPFYSMFLLFRGVEK